ncbi:MAG TPA: hypothetical protein PLA97_13250 [Rubrivivax sp.]|nr:hypothetical protein [Rubrivivax sp.]
MNDKERRPADRKRTVREAIVAATTPGHQPVVPLTEQLAEHLLAVLFFILLPAAWTALMPVAWTSFTREGPVVTATTHKHLLLVVPYTWQTLRGVTGVDFDYESGTWTRSISTRTRSEDKAWIVLTGGPEKAVIPVDAEEAQDTARSMQAFLQDPNWASNSWFTYADFIFSLVASGVLTLLPLFYLSLWGLKAWLLWRAH